MLERQKRLNEVYAHLYNHLGVHNKGDFADKIQYARAYISSAMNGNERYLTDKLFRSICEAYPNVFNLNYLINGEGELLVSSKYDYTEQKSHPFPSVINECNPIPQWVDAILSIVSRQIKENETLNRELRSTIKEVSALRTDLQSLIQTLKK